MATSHADYDAVLASPIGPLGLHMANGRLAAIDFLSPGAEPRMAPAAVDVVSALKDWFADAEAALDFPLALTGTPFQQRVWAALRAIPTGETRTYGALAAELGSAARAVAGACRANPVPIVVPCHRAVAAHGLGGYCGATTGPAIAAKQWLLDHERRR